MSAVANRVDSARLDATFDAFVAALADARAGATQAEAMILSSVVAIIVRTRLVEADLVPAHAWGAPSMMGAKRFAEVFGGR